MNTTSKSLLVSIIMPAYNSRKYLEKAINSVLEQTYQNWELLIVDDCSTDGTLDLIKKYQLKDNRIKYSVLKKNSGPAVARNRAIDMAQGTFIAFLDSDDIWFKNKLEKQLFFMQKNNYDFSCTAYTKIDENGINLNNVIETPMVRDYWGLLKNCPGNSTVVYNSDKLGKIKVPNIKKRNDYVMVMVSKLHNFKHLNKMKCSKV